MEEKTEAPVEHKEHTPSTPSEHGWYKATFLRRLGAAFIDGLILMGVQLVLMFVIPEDFRSYAFIINLLYSVLFIWQKGATPGKMALGIKVVLTNGENLNLLQAFLREVVGKFLSSLIFCLGYLWMLWDQNSQTWHDKIAGSYVVTKIPNDGKKSGCLVAAIIALIVFPVAIAIIAAVVVMMINPLELTRRSRDAQRMTDAANVQAALNQVGIKAIEAGVSPKYCGNLGTECMGTSDIDNTESSGNGWVKADISSNGAVSMPVLPVDPTNNDLLHYTYCATEDDYEINFKIESEQYMPKMMEDQGDNNNLYELGSNLTLCK